MGMLLYVKENTYLYAYFGKNDLLLAQKCRLENGILCLAGLSITEIIYIGHMS